jgi:hypothetical protein
LAFASGERMSSPEYWKHFPYRWRIVATDNFDGDYPNESFHGPLLSEHHAKTIADLFNGRAVNPPRYFKVVEMPYELARGFEP